LSINLQAFVSQRLIPTVDGKRCAAIEILLNSGRVADLINAGAVTEIKEVMEKSEAMGMRTFDSALYHLYQDGKISLDEALKNADAANNLRLRIELGEKGNKGAGGSGDDALSGLSLIEEPEEEEEEEEVDPGLISHTVKKKVQESG
jgi:twitching motility protein PilU